MSCRGRTVMVLRTVLDVVRTHYRPYNALWITEAYRCAGCRNTAQ